MIYLEHVSSKDSWIKPKDGSNSWIEYWEKHSCYSLPVYCPDCHEFITSFNPLVGAHVKKVYSSDNNIYIVPVCKKCNTIAATDNHRFYCSENLLVPANKDKL